MAKDAQAEALPVIDGSHVPFATSRRGKPMAVSKLLRASKHPALSRFAKQRGNGLTNLNLIASCNGTVNPHAGSPHMCPLRMLGPLGIILITAVVASALLALAWLQDWGGVREVVGDFILSDKKLDFHRFSKRIDAAIRGKGANLLEVW